jgi:nitroreductase
MSRSTAPSAGARGIPAGWTDVLEYAVDRGRLAPSVHNTQPWAFEFFPDRLEVRADRSRQLTVLDPSGRELIQSVGAALFNLRASLAARSFAVYVERMPAQDDPDLLAVLRPCAGPADPALGRLDRVAHLRHTNRRPFGPATLPDDVLANLVDVVAAEDVLLVPARTEEHCRLVAELTREADRVQSSDPAYRAELRLWTNRQPADGDGVPADVVPHAGGMHADDVPVRDFDTRRTGLLPNRTGSGTAQTLLVLATVDDDAHAWLRSGEALERLLLELTRIEWVASPLTQSLELASTRARLRAMTSPAHPQMLLRVGQARPTATTGRRPRRSVVRNSHLPAPPPPPRQIPPLQTTTEPTEQPVSDGRGGTTWP